MFWNFESKWERFWKMMKHQKFLKLAAHFQNWSQEMGLKILHLQSNFVFNFAERSDGNISKDSWKRWSNTLLKTVGDNYGKEEAKLKAEKVGCLGSNLRPMSIPSIWPLPLTFIWVEQSDEHTSNAHKLQRIIYER